MTTGKTIALTRRTFVGKVMSLLFNMLSRLVITFLPGSKCLLISCFRWYLLGEDKIEFSGILAVSYDLIWVCGVGGIYQTIQVIFEHSTVYVLYK